MLKITILIILILLVLIAGYIYTKNLVIVPEVNGVLVDDDMNPVANTEIVRSWHWAWANQSGQDIVVTQDDGSFSMPAVYGKSVTAQVLPHEPNIRVSLAAKLEDETKEFFTMRKAEYTLTDVRHNMKVRPLHIRCGVQSLPGDEDDMVFNSTCVFLNTSENQ